MNIINIAAKDLRQMGVLTAGVLVLFALLMFLSSYLPIAVITALAVVLSGAYVVVAFFSGERYEDKHNGYNYLLKLPVLPAEIAAGKLIPIYVMNMLGIGLMAILFRFLFTGRSSLHLSQSIALMAGCVWLLLLLLMFAGICILGFSRFVIVFRIAIMSLLVVTQGLGVLAFRMGKDFPLLLTRIGDGVAAVPWLIVCLIVSALFAAFIAGSGNLVRRHSAR